MQDPAFSQESLAPETVPTPPQGVADVGDPEPKTHESDHASVASSGLGIIAALVLCSGACGLVYQTAWLRELRLIFGASTSATAATLAIFMAGLGVGSLWLGPRADRSTNPLRFYGMLELGIAASAALSPVLLALVRAVYVALGGSSSMGPLGSTLVRLLLTTLALGIPAVLMGGTLPAVARSVVSSADPGRRRLALVYGINTLGAVGGVMLTTFLLLERFGTHLTVWFAAALNLVAGLNAVAFSSSRPSAAGRLRLVSTTPTVDGARAVAPRFVYLASALVGFVFFLMELVWYRMLAPLLSGSTYTFGLILAVALLGISVGSALYGPVAGRRRPGLAWFAASCALEALTLAIPFALGDRLAVMALLLRPLGAVGLFGSVAAWTVTISIVVLPTAVVAGFQFPLLVRLLGSGETDLGGHTGRAYGWNTAGAILGSLAGGFGLLPWLSAPGVWRLSAGVLAVMSVVTVVRAVCAERSRAWVRIAALGVATGAVLLVLVPGGPTGFWRHSGIGAGRAGATAGLTTPNDVRGQVDLARSEIAWEAEGRESSIAASNETGLALIVGGKSDGNVIVDSGTQIMLGMVGALLHPRPHRALVIGLGTGGTSGWLSLVPSIERVDTIELEPAVVEFAKRCAVANQNATGNPRDHIVIGDGREFVQTTHETYDLIASEPSNPYRAGVASLFTREFYLGASKRLSEGGLFLQWVQAYEADFETIRIVYATMRSVFPNVETWTTMEGDLLLVASRQPIATDVTRLRERIASEPYRTAIQRAWRARDAEGILAHYLGDGGFATTVAGMGEPTLNTDDRTILEYRFARNLGQAKSVNFDDLRMLAMLAHHATPPWTGLELMDQAKVSLQKATMHAMQMMPPPAVPQGNPLYDRIAAIGEFTLRNNDESYMAWKRTIGKPVDLTELAIAATVMCEQGDAGAQALIDELRAYRPVEADFLLARLDFARGDLAAATSAYESACHGYRADPWVWLGVAEQQLPLAGMIAQKGDSSLTARLFAALGTPFAVSCANQRRLVERLVVARCLDSGAPGRYTREALDGFGPVVPWTAQILKERVACYQRMNDPRLDRARMDFERFEASEPPQLTFERPEPTPHS